MTYYDCLQFSPMSSLHALQQLLHTLKYHPILHLNPSHAHNFPSPDEKPHVPPQSPAYSWSLSKPGKPLSTTANAQQPHCKAGIGPRKTQKAAGTVLFLTLNSPTTRLSQAIAVASAAVVLVLLLAAGKEVEWSSLGLGF